MISDILIHSSIKDLVGFILLGLCLLGALIVVLTYRIKDWFNKRKYNKYGS